MLQVLLCQLTKTLDNPSHLSARWATASRAQAESRPGTSDTPSCNLGPVASPILLASCDGVYMVLKTIRSRQKQKLLPTLPQQSKHRCSIGQPGGSKKYGGQAYVGAGDRVTPRRGLAIPIKQANTRACT